MANNAGMLEYWNGEAGQRWVDYQAHIDLAIEIFGSRALQRLALQKGEKVVDVGCGAGTTVLSLSKGTTDAGEVLGLDASQALMDLAKKRTEHLTNVEMICTDAATYDLKPGHYDAIFSRFGMMFFDRPAEALHHLGKGLRSGGRMSFVCWQNMEDNDWVSLPLQTVLPLVVDPPSPYKPNSPGPCAFADEDFVHSQLSEAGFLNIHIQNVRAPVTLGDTGVEDAVNFSLRIGPCARIGAGQSPEVVAAMRKALTDMFESIIEGHGVTLPGAAWLVSAHKA
jgi:SAM-dependent methyltransferase